MQAYPGRDPVREALRGEITPRTLRVMCEHLPPKNPAARELSSVWGDDEHLLYDIDSQMRLMVHILTAVHRSEDDPNPLPPLTFLDHPDQGEDEQTGGQQKSPEEIREEQDAFLADLAKGRQRGASR